MKLSTIEKTVKFTKSLVIELTAKEAKELAGICEQAKWGQFPFAEKLYYYVEKKIGEAVTITYSKDDRLLVRARE